MTTDSFRASCEALLRANDRGNYTVPSGKVYPHQWAWDSAFAAIGWAHIDPERAWLELETLMAAQWDDGRVPHIVFHQHSDDYFPGPEFWEVSGTSSISQPPIWATAARRIVEVSGWSERGAALLPAFARSHRWFLEARDPKQWGVITVAHPWESGMDNLPVWDAPLANIDRSNVPAFTRRDKDTVGDASVRPSDEHYEGYAVLVKAIAEDGFGQGPFAVYDPFMSACLARAEADLCWLAKVAGVSHDESLAPSIRKGLATRLFDAKSGRARYIDVHGADTDADIASQYAPLFALDEGEHPDEVAALRAGIERYLHPRPLPTTHPDDPRYDPRRYWRGPCWVSLNWLFADALPEIIAPTLEMVKQAGFCEYFIRETGEGVGASHFTWTAALALDLDAR